MKKHSKTGAEKVRFAIAVLSALLASVFVYLQLREPRFAPTQRNVSKPSTMILPDEEPGYSIYYWQDHDIGFLFPEEQEPLKATPAAPHNAIESVQSRDFEINLYRAPGFSYQPWPKSDSCIYDGALNGFASQKNGCNIAAVSIEGVQVFEGLFYVEEKTKHTYLAPLQSRQYFLEISTVYEADCKPTNYRPADVCAARSDAAKEKLKNFVRSIAVKNPMLFSR